MDMTYKEIREINVYIDRLDYSNKLMYDALKEWWLSSYLYENIPAVIGQWTEKYINTDVTKDAIEKIKEASPPEDFLMVVLAIFIMTLAVFMIFVCMSIWYSSNLSFLH